MAHPRPTRRKPGAVFLDAAGTLIQLREPVGQTYSRVAEAHGLAADPGALEQAFRSAWRRHPAPLHPENQPPADDDQSWWREIVRLTLAGAGFPDLPPARLDPLFDQLYGHYASPEAWRLYDDARDALPRLRREARLFVVSNFDRRLHRILDGLGVSDHFERIIVSSEVGAAKPHPRIFRAALASAGLPAPDCLHVGDERATDLEGATAAGITCFHLDRPHVTLATLMEKLESGDFPACIRAKSD